MTYINCGGCGVTIADRDASGAHRPCPRCLLRGVILPMRSLRHAQAAGASSSVLGSPSGSKTFARRGLA